MQRLKWVAFFAGVTLLGPSAGHAAIPSRTPSAFFWTRAVMHAGDQYTFECDRVGPQPATTYSTEFTAFAVTARNGSNEAWSYEGGATTENVFVSERVFGV